jgi:hypothetical protein
VLSRNENYLVDEKVDHFDGDRIYELRADVTCYNLEKCKMSSYVRVNKEGKAQTFCLRWTHMEDSWNWLHGHRVRFLVDGDLWQLQESFDHEVMAGPICYEAVQVYLTGPQLKKLILADNVDMEIGGTRIVVARDDWEKVKAPFAMWLFRTE